MAGEKKKTLIKVLLISFLIILAIWLLLTGECVVGRADSGIPVDWANIKDCSY